MTMTVLVLFGSLRAASISTQIAALAPRAAPAGVTVQNAEGLDALPFYNQDLDTAQPPPPVARLRAQVDAADAVLLVTPANNGSVSAVLKNAIDWLSRPRENAALHDKPALLSADAGRDDGVGTLAGHHLGLCRSEGPGEAGQGVLVGSDVGDHGVAVQRLPGRGAGGVAKADQHLRDSLPGEHPVSHRGDKPLMSLRWSPVTVDLPAAIGAAVNVLGMQRQQKRQVRGGQWWDVLAAAGTLHDAQEHLQRLRAQRRQGVEAGVHRPAVGRRRCPRLRALDAERFGDHPARLVVIEWSGPGGGSGGDRRIQWYPAGFADDLLMQPPQRQHRHVVARGGVLFQSGRSAGHAMQVQDRPDIVGVRAEHTVDQLRHHLVRCPARQRSAGLGDGVGPPPPAGMSVNDRDHSRSTRQLGRRPSGGEAAHRCACGRP